MSIKTLTTSIAVLCLLAATAATAQGDKGIVNALDPDRKWISVNNDDVVIDENVRVQTFSGMIRTTDHLAARQYVDYKLNNYGRVSEIRIYDPKKLLEQGFYTEEHVSH